MRVPSFQINIVAIEKKNDFIIERLHLPKYTTCCTYECGRLPISALKFFGYGNGMVLCAVPCGHQA
jgi:hypothetical protein